MVDIKTIDEVVTFLLTADLAAIITMPLALPQGYLLGRLHECGLKDGKSGAALMWMYFSKVDIRDLHQDAFHDPLIIKNMG